MLNVVVAFARALVLGRDRATEFTKCATTIRQQEDTSCRASDNSNRGSAPSYSIVFLRGVDEPRTKPNVVSHMSVAVYEVRTDEGETHYSTYGELRGAAGRALGAAGNQPRNCDDALWQTAIRAIPAGGFVCRKGDSVDHWLGVLDGLVKVGSVSQEGKLISFTGVPAGGAKRVCSIVARATMSIT